MIAVFTGGKCIVYMIIMSRKLKKLLKSFRVLSLMREKEMDQSSGKIYDCFELVSNCFSLIFQGEVKMMMAAESYTGCHLIKRGFCF